MTRLPCPKFCFEFCNVLLNKFVLFCDQFLTHLLFICLSVKFHQLPYSADFIPTYITFLFHFRNISFRFSHTKIVSL